MMLVGDTAISNGWSLFPLLTWLLTLQIPQIIRKSFGHWNPRDLWDNVIRHRVVRKSRGRLNRQDLHENIVQKYNLWDW